MPIKRNLTQKTVSKKEQPINPQIKALMDRINKTYGENTVMLASEAVGLDYVRSSTGSFGLDMGVGGGFCFGRVHLILGKESAGKTALCCSAIANVHRKYPDSYCAFLDAEQTFDKRKAGQLGVDLRRLIIINPDSLEQGGDVTQELLEERILKVFVIDSWAALMPTAEYEDDMQKGSMGRNALAKNKFVRKIISALKKDLASPEPTCMVLIINHINMNVGVTWGSPETDSGGMGKNYLSSIRVKLTKTEIIKEEDSDDDKKAIGIVVKWDVTKNKTDAPYKTGSYDYYYGYGKKNASMGIDRTGEILEYAKKHKLAPEGMRRASFEAMYSTPEELATITNEIMRRENAYKIRAKDGGVSEGEIGETRKTSDKKLVKKLGKAHSK